MLSNECTSLPQKFEQVYDIQTAEPVLAPSTDNSCVYIILQWHRQSKERQSVFVCFSKSSFAHAMQMGVLSIAMPQMTFNSSGDASGWSPAPVVTRVLMGTEESSNDFCQQLAKRIAFKCQVQCILLDNVGTEVEEEVRMQIEKCVFRAVQSTHKTNDATLVGR